MRSCICALLLWCMIAPVCYSLSPETKQVNCPAVDSIQKDRKTLQWSSKDSLFKSYSQSFSSKIHTFIGAQWSGAQVGQITCVYLPQEKRNFPILLVFHALTLEPSSKFWSSHKAGVRNCMSKNVLDCPFVVRVRQKTGNLVQEVQSLKAEDDAGSDQ